VVPSNLKAVQRRALYTLFDRIYKRGRRVQWNRDFNPEKSRRRQWLGYAIVVAMGMLMVSFVPGKTPFLVFVTLMHSFTTLVAGLGVMYACSEILFHEQESDILLHRPVETRLILQVKAWVIFNNIYLQILLFNLLAMAFALSRPEVDARFLVSHALTLGLNILGTLSFVILAYHVCLKLFGRERLRNFMTTAQIVAAFAILFSSQASLRYFKSVDGSAWQPSVWLNCFPTVWLANLESLILGLPRTPFLWTGVVLALLVPLLLAWLALSVLAGAYEEAVSALNEQAPPRRITPGQERRWAERWTRSWWAKIWMRDPVERAGFLLTLAQVTRVRNVKLKFFTRLLQFSTYPCYFMMAKGIPQSPWLGFFFPGVFGLIGYTLGDVILHSEEFSGADIFRFTPLPSPAALFYGAQKATLALAFIPILFIWSTVLVLLTRDVAILESLIPSVLFGLTCSYVPVLTKPSLIFSLSDPVGMAFSKGCLFQLLPMLVGALIGGISYFAQQAGLFHAWVLVLAVGFFFLSKFFRARLERQPLDLEAT
jgi:ABC-2 type transport system permease protein